MPLTHAQRTTAFLSGTTPQTKALILDNIANHYGITPQQAFEEVTDKDAESLLDYVTGPERAAASVIMQASGFRN